MAEDEQKTIESVAPKEEAPEEVKRIKIIVDSREGRSELLQSLKKMGCDIEILPLDVADYVLSSSVAIEVKASISDFCNSLQDGRLFDELYRLKDAYESPLLLINGIMSYDFQRNKTFTYRQVWSKSLKKMINVKVDLHRHPYSIIGALNTIEVKMGIPILWTTNIHSAAHRLYTIAKQQQYEEKKPLRIQKAKKAGLSLPERQRLVVESITGPATAEALLSHFGSPLKIFLASDDELLKIKGVGPKTVDEIKNILTTKYESIEEKRQNKE